MKIDDSADQRSYLHIELVASFQKYRCEKVLAMVEVTRGRRRQYGQKNVGAVATECRTTYA